MYYEFDYVSAEGLKHELLAGLATPLPIFLLAESEKNRCGIEDDDQEIRKLIEQSRRIVVDDMESGERFIKINEIPKDESYGMALVLSAPGTGILFVRVGSPYDE